MKKKTTVMEKLPKICGKNPRYELKMLEHIHMERKKRKGKGTIQNPDYTFINSGKREHSLATRYIKYSQQSLILLHNLRRRNHNREGESS